MKKFIKNNFYFILIILFITVNFNSLEKIYLIHLKDYNQRLLDSMEIAKRRLWIC